MRRATSLLLAQHKPFSFLSPSTAPRGNKKFAVDLLVQKNNAVAAPWVTNAQLGAPPRSADHPRSVPGLVCIGRLDADTTGLMLWTDDADMARRVMSADSGVEKEYLVRVKGHEAWDERRRERTTRLLAHGMAIDGVPLHRATAGWLNGEQLRVVLTEGRHRQVRKMCDMVGLEVLALKRVRIGPIRLGGLRTGQWSALPSHLQRRLWAAAVGQDAPGDGSVLGGSSRECAIPAEGTLPKRRNSTRVTSSRVVNEVVI